MAIYHFSGKTISRSRGRSSVETSAYRSAERLRDKRTGLTHNFASTEKDIFFKFILLPKEAPKGYQDREILWNSVEEAEKRKDSQLAREFNIALPRELNEKKLIELIQDFVKTAFVEKGMIADITCYRGESANGEENPHAYVLLTMREVTEKGFGLKVRAWNQRSQIFKWRELWAEKANQHLHCAGICQRIDHRTLEAQGIDLIPQKKIGPNYTPYYEEKKAYHKAIARANGKALLENPSIAWKALTQHQSSFTKKELERLVHRQAADKRQFNRAYKHLLSSPELILLKDQNKQMRRDLLLKMINFVRLYIAIFPQKKLD